MFVAVWVVVVGWRLWLVECALESGSLLRRLVGWRRRGCLSVSSGLGRSRSVLVCGGALGHVERCG